MRWLVEAQKHFGLCGKRNGASALDSSIENASLTLDNTFY